FRWVETLGLAYLEGAGHERRAVSVVGTVQDITERKEREEKVLLLMREINHRAKNMLSVVDSIARQTATKNPEDFIERFSERIQALSANQDLLVRNEWNGVRSRTWFAPNSRISRRSLVLVSTRRAQDAPDSGFRASRRACTPRTRYQCRQIRGALDQ